jgi:hypothetical protein
VAFDAWKVGLESQSLTLNIKKNEVLFLITKPAFKSKNGTFSFRLTFSLKIIINECHCNCAYQPWSLSNGRFKYFLKFHHFTRS